MKDTFDLKKFLTENKSIENLNPFLAESIDEKKSLKDQVREMILAELSEAKKDEDEEEGIEDVEVEDTEEFQPDTEEETSTDLEADEKEIMDSLENALEFAKQKGDEKLIDQIGNTITFFTRQYIVK